MSITAIATNISPEIINDLKNFGATRMKMESLWKHHAKAFAFGLVFTGALFGIIAGAAGLDPKIIGCVEAGIFIVGLAIAFGRYSCAKVKIQREANMTRFFRILEQIDKNASSHADAMAELKKACKTFTKKEWRVVWQKLQNTHNDNVHTILRTLNPDIDSFRPSSPKTSNSNYQLMAAS